jgi:hypothetical protein
MRVQSVYLQPRIMRHKTSEKGREGIQITASF